MHAIHDSAGLWTLAWRRLRADRLAMGALAVVAAFLLLLAASASGLVAADWEEEVAVNYAPPTFAAAPQAAPAPAGQGATMRAYLGNLGFTAVARHKSRDITLFRQGTINFLLNESTGSFASGFAAEHGPSACGFAITASGIEAHCHTPPDTASPRRQCETAPVSVSRRTKPPSAGTMV